MKFSLSSSSHRRQAGSENVIVGSENRIVFKSEKKLKYTLSSMFKKIKIKKTSGTGRLLVPALGVKKTHQYNTPITEDPLIAS